MNTITDLYKNSFIKAVIDANKELGTYLDTKLTKKDFTQTSSIGYGGDKTLHIDLIAENIFIKYLNDFGNIFSEECGFLDSNKEYTIVIDPIDGSDNFKSNLAYYGTSVALQSNDITIAGFVCNLASKTIRYRAFDDNVKYISLDGKTIVDNQINSDLAIFERSYAYPSICKILHSNKIKYRSPGAVALSLANAKNFKFVLFIGKLRDFDIAAALYICNDLFIEKNDEFLCISKNIEINSKIKEFIKEELVITPR